MSEISERTVQTLEARFSKEDVHALLVEAAKKQAGRRHGTAQFKGEIVESDGYSGFVVMLVRDTKAEEKKKEAA